MKPKILVTGGAGYIGSHTVLELLKQNYSVVVIDSLSNSSKESIRRVELLTGKKIKFYKIDLCDAESVNYVLENNIFDAVIHFAGLKAVGESVSQPLRYYHNNLLSTIVLCEAMQKAGVRHLIFSSSATVYGRPKAVPIKESAKIQPINPYGQTKAMIELMLKGLTDAGNGWKVSVLRYFNPVGADVSGKIGEHPNGIPNNLMPFVAQVAVGLRDKVMVFGNDYSTPDGTGVRDYIHVTDLALGHISALKHPAKPNTLAIYNLGVGQGHSVLEVIKAFEKVSGKHINYEFAPRRPGDIDTCYADASKANRELVWVAKKSLEEACYDTWRWQSSNPAGYDKS